MKDKKTKFIFVTGGVCSSLGKGISTASLGLLLEGHGYKLSIIKMDPYINIDPGTMSPFQHGEVYVTEDGAETDLDLGYYERLTNAELTRKNSISTGQIYYEVITRERRGDYLGRTVQVIPHITDEIKGRILAVGKEPDVDVVIVEIGGTVGDIESIPFLEAARQLIHEMGKTNALSVHLTLLPEVAGGELKTKPTQHSVKAMQEQGIQPDVLICRAPVMLDEATRRKIALFTNVETEAVFTSYDVTTTIYEIPLVFYEQKLDQVILKKLNVESRHADLSAWKTMMDQFNARKGSVRIGIVGKYMDLHDAYKSVYEALFHAGLSCGVAVELVKIDSSRLEGDSDPDQILGKDLSGGPLDGILVPGGFGERGIEGKIAVAKYARENNIPYLGICFGMHIAVIECARNLANLPGASSVEFDEFTPNPVIHLREDQLHRDKVGGTMHLGAFQFNLVKGSKAFEIYQTETISERHRHRYEFNNDYREVIEKAGLKISGLSPDGLLVEIVEYPQLDFFVAVQFHPEFKSRPINPHPLFREFVKAAAKK